MPFHIFLSHSSADKPAVEELTRRLAKEGIPAWPDKWHLIPGDPWQAVLEKALVDSEACPYRKTSSKLPGPDEK